MANKTTYTVFVHYEGYSPEKDNRIRKLAGREDSGSGVGFGVRDLHFDFQSRNAAYSRAERIRRGLHRVNAYVVEGT